MCCLHSLWYHGHFHQYRHFCTSEAFPGTKLHHPIQLEHNLPTQLHLCNIILCRHAYSCTVIAIYCVYMQFCELKILSTQDMDFQTLPPHLTTHSTCPPGFNRLQPWILDLRALYCTRQTAIIELFIEV